MMWLVTQKMWQVEVPIRSSATNPSLLDWFCQRDTRL